MYLKILTARAKRLLCREFCAGRLTALKKFDMIEISAKFVLVLDQNSPNHVRSWIVRVYHL